MISSNRRVFRNGADGNNNRQTEAGNNSRQTKTAQNHRATQTHIRSDHEILEVPPDASQEQIDAAYRRLSQMYHPDKVESLAPEYKAIAVARMKEVNAAYERLKSQGKKQ